MASREAFSLISLSLNAPLARRKKGKGGKRGKARSGQVTDLPFSLFIPPGSGRSSLQGRKGKKGGRKGGGGPAAWTHAVFPRVLGDFA